MLLRSGGTIREQNLVDSEEMAVLTGGPAVGHARGPHP